MQIMSLFAPVNRINSPSLVKAGQGRSRHVALKFVIKMMLVLLLSICFTGIVGASDRVTLVSNGKPVSVIVTDADRNQKMGVHGERPLWEVVLDLQRIMERMSGAKVPIVSPRDVPVDVAKIYVGDAFPLSKLDEKALDPRGYWVIAEENALVLRGKTEGGTINAIYGFLQDKLDVRWFFPSELFEVIPEKATLSVPFGREVHNPSFKGGMFSPISGITKDGEIWAERMRRDAEVWKYQASTVHYLGYILDSGMFANSNPEFYPLINGERQIPPPGDRNGPQPCLSNKDLLDTVVAACRKAFDENPGLLMCAIGENDSSEWCECEECRAMDVLPLEKIDGHEQHSDRFFTFANQVALAVQQTHPGKLVGCLAYHGTLSVPKKIDKLEPNVAIGLCVDTSQYYDSSYKAKDRGILDSWKAKSQLISTYDYLSLGWTAPRYYPGLYSDFLKEMHRDGILSIYSEVNPYWATSGPMIYLAAQMMWNVELDPNLVLDDLFVRLFGKEAGAEMKAYYGVFENAWMRKNPDRAGKWFQGWSYMSEQMAVYRLADLELALKHLEKAAALAKEPVAQKRIEYISHSFRYAEVVMRGWLTGDEIEAKVNNNRVASRADAQELREMLKVVADATKTEGDIYDETLLVDPISSKSYYKDDFGDHFGIIRGQWKPRCDNALRVGSAALVKFYNTHKMTDELASLRSDLPEEVVKAAELEAAETLGRESIRGGRMESVNFWDAHRAVLSIDSNARDNGRSIKIEVTGENGGILQAFPVKPNTKYNYDFWYKCGPNATLYMYVTFAGQSGNATGSHYRESQWTRVTGSFTTSESCKTATIAFSGYPGQFVLIDDVSVREVRGVSPLACERIDSDFPDWTRPTFVLATADKLGTSTPPEKWAGPEKFSAAVCLGWNDDGLRVVVKATDAEHRQRYAGTSIWMGDSIQFGINTAGDGAKRRYGSGYDGVHDFVYGLSKRDSPNQAPEMYCWAAPKNRPTGTIANDGDSHKYTVSMNGGDVVYDAFISWKYLGGELDIGSVFDFNLVVFNLLTQPEGNEELIWLQLTPGIAGREAGSPSLWKTFVLAERAVDGGLSPEM